MKIYFYSILIVLGLLSCQNEENTENEVKVTHEELMTNLKSENDSIKNGSLDLVKDFKSYRNMIYEIEIQIAEIEQRRSKLIIVSGKTNETQLSQDDMMMHLKYINISLHNIRLKSSHLHESLISLSKENKLERDSIKLLKQELHNSIKLTMDKEAKIDSLHENISDGTEVYNIVFEEYKEQRSYSNVLYSIIHTKFYYVGTKEELLSKEIIKNIDGDVYGLNADANDALFKTIVAGKQDIIDLNCNSVKLLSVHPEDSYELIGDNPITGLKIIDYKMFWDKTEFLVIQID